MKNWELLEKEITKALTSFSKEYNKRNEVHKMHLELVQYNNFKVDGGKGDVMTIGVKRSVLNKITEERKEDIIIKQSSQFEHPSQLDTVEWKIVALRGIMRDLVGCMVMIANAQEYEGK
jgi:hypothetical protein